MHGENMKFTYNLLNISNTAKCFK